MYLLATAAVLGISVVEMKRLWRRVLWLTRKELIMLHMWEEAGVPDWQLSEGLWMLARADEDAFFLLLETANVY